MKLQPFPDYDYRRSLMSAGPFPLASGQTTKYTIASLIAHGQSNLQNLNELAILSDQLDTLLPSLKIAQRPGRKIIKNPKIFPNPGNGKIQIETPGTIDRLYVTDPMGKIQLETSSEKRISTLDLSDLKHGIYFIHILSEGETSIKRFIKNQ